MPQWKTIKKIYTSKWLTPPKWKWEHTTAFHKIASAIQEQDKKGWLTKEEKNKSYAIAMSKLWRNKAVNKSHWKENKKK